MKLKTFFLPRFYFFKESKCQEPHVICCTEANGIACATQLFSGYCVCFELLKYIRFRKENNIEQHRLQNELFLLKSSKNLRALSAPRTVFLFYLNNCTMNWKQIRAH